MSEKKMTITIEGQEYAANDGDTILDVARRNGVQIPTICYLSGCSPTLACKMCMVEVNGKRAYSCNAKVKDKMDVIVHNDALDSDRNDIMTTYCVNHPLECGVCDKSGECELQDFTLYTAVDTQKWGLKEAEKKSYSFAQSFYDPALCIMCERCATTCKDNIGENNLKAGKATLYSPDNYKDSMSKDPFSVWQKRQKGLIEFIGKYECKDCGECISACPVGAMTYKDFTYTSNAWELEKIYSTCTHCAGGCELIYNVKHLDVKGDLRKVYRVQNDYLYNPICGAGRFAFDNVSVGTRNLSSVLAAFRRADSILLGGSVSNEEAFITQLIASHLGIPIYNTEAKFYQVFQHAFLRGSAWFGLESLESSLESGALDSADSKGVDSKFLGEINSPFATYNDVKTGQNIIALNAYFKYDSPSIRYKVNNNLKMQKGTNLLSFGIFKDSLLQGLGKSVTQIVGNPQNISVMGILGLIFANDLIDEFESSFPGCLDMMLKPHNSDIQGFVIKEDSKDFIESKSQDSNIESNAETTQDSNIESNADSNDSKNAENAEPVDNLSPYNIESILQNLNISKLDSIKLAKKGGVLLISYNTIHEFINSDLLQNISIANPKLKQDSSDNALNIANAISSTIAESLTNELNNEIMDYEARIQILAYLLAFLSQKLELKLLYIPKESNILGIANICDLQNPYLIASHLSVGVRSLAGDFRLDSNVRTIKPHFALPTPAQLEGTTTNMEHRVLKLNPNIPFLDSNLESAFDLSDIARELGVFDSNDSLDNTDYLGDFSELISEFVSKDFKFKPLHFLDLNEKFTRGGDDIRGYNMVINNEIFSNLNSLDLKFNINLDSKNANNIESKFEFLALKLDNQNQFNMLTKASNNLQSKVGIYANKALLERLDCKDGDIIMLENQKGSVESPIFLDNDLDSDIFLVSPLIDNESIFFSEICVRVNALKVAQNSLESEKIG